MKQRLIKYLLLFLIGINGACSISYSQEKPRTDSSAPEFNLEYPCLYARYRTSILSSGVDSLLYDFYYQVENTRDFSFHNYNRDSLDVLFELLKKAEADTNESCLLPFLRIFDPKSDSIAKENCQMRSWIPPHTIYCEERTTQFLVLFYLQFKIVSPLKPKKGLSFSGILLTKKNEAIFIKDITEIPRPKPLTEKQWKNFEKRYEELENEEDEEKQKKGFDKLYKRYKNDKYKYPKYRRKNAKRLEEYPERYILTQEDYQKIYQAYYNWIDAMKRGKKIKDPLKKTDYRWEVVLQ